jgi:hypothetical protein
MCVGDRKGEEGPCTVWVDRWAAGDVTYSASKSEKDCRSWSLKSREMASTKGRARRMG